MIKALIFDCWGTLFANSQKPHPFTIFAERLGYDIRDRVFLKPFERHLMTNENDISRNVVNLLNELNIEPEEKLTHELSSLIIGSIETQIAFPDTLAILDDLRKKYRLILLSNTFKEGFSNLDNNYHLKSWFELIVLSYKEGTVKPNKILYEKILSESHLTPDEVMMIGDNYDDDILAANAVSINGILLDRADRYPDISTNKVSNLEQLKKYL